jgi:aspartyl-tRNA(Asn)/glutamyl-tRNA(Gln) amidotransferase subunit B
VNDGNLEEGSFRCDANVSIRPRGVTKLGTRCELKNINSFRFVQRAIDSEIARQTAVLDAGGSIAQETRSFDPDTGKTATLRSKEEAHDYRYFPEPDLPPLTLDAAFVEKTRSELGELPQAMRSRYVDKLRLTQASAQTLTRPPRDGAVFRSGMPRLSRAGEGFELGAHRSAPRCDAPRPRREVQREPRAGRRAP